MRTIIILSAVAISLSACGGSDERAAEAVDAETARYDVDEENGDSQFRISGDDGQEMIINSGNGVSADLPDGYSIYPDATVLNTTTMNQPDGQGTLVIMQSDASPEAMVKFYRSQATNAGIEIGMEMNSNGTMMVAGESEDGGTFSFNASSTGDSTTGQLVVGQTEE
ncbi:MAG: hypothetical protein WA957_17435 [Alteraurantiacibacter sp.]